MSNEGIAIFLSIGAWSYLDAREAHKEKRGINLDVERGERLLEQEDIKGLANRGTLQEYVDQLKRRTELERVNINDPVSKLGPVPRSSLGPRKE